MSERVLVVDDEAGLRAFLAEVLRGLGLEVVEASDGAEALAELEKQSFHLLLTDLRMPRLGGEELVARARAIAPEMEVVVLTAHGSVESAVRTMKLGAFDYLRKPLSSPDELRLVATRALERGRLRRRAEGGAERSTFTLIAEDPLMRRAVEQLERVAPTPATVLLLGESGTGKEVAARFVHAQSPRASAPFVAVNCAAVAEQLVESELFGHEKGAFTGASERRRGRFELAEGGTLFLDEIGELDASLQAKLLRALEERSFERVGGTRAISVDVRIVAATNRDPQIEMREGRLREDLYHRLAVFPLRLPPLRERPGDLLPLARHLLGEIGRELARGDLALEPEAEEHLAAHSWPGNVRELRNALERAAILSQSGRIGASELALEGGGVLGAGGGPRGAGGAYALNPVLDAPLREIERAAIERALELEEGHRRRAAERLGIGLRTLYDKLRAHGIGR